MSYDRLVHLISIKPTRKNKKTVLLFAVLSIGVLALIFWRFPRLTTIPLPDSFPGLTKEMRQEPTKEPNILNGLPVETAYARRRPLAIMIENHTEARPQVGLTKAAVIYEAIAEGGITRFLAVFGPYDAEKIGPVRSARQYYVEWVKGMDALYAHVGGSQEALGLIRTLKIADLDQFRWGSQAYWREPKVGVAVEHTMFTSTVKLYEVAKKAKHDLAASLTPYLFKKEVPVEERGSTQTITVDFSTPAYKVVWTYDAANNTYLRSHGGVEHKDRVLGERISAKTIVIATLKRQLKTEDQGPGWTMTTIGQGKARVFQDGQEIVGTWRRPSKTDMLRFYDETGKEISFNRGTIWIEIVHPEIAVTVQ
jgi:hypothetical protein